MGLSFIYAAPAFSIDNQVPKDWAEDEAQGKNFAGQADLFNIPGVSLCVLDDSTAPSTCRLTPGRTCTGSNISTLTFDFGIIIKGSIQLKLDGGEEKTLQTGDVILQKGTNHMWTNTHPTEWARIYFVLTNALPISIAGVGDSEAKVLSKVGV
ncbi:hypothetical protein B0H13DRAFT_2329512 [Mycena leptocephala]|nr:hypothetical protein B0H13DRAFT_2329512 [Mycena leptocephala]